MNPPSCSTAPAPLNRRHFMRLASMTGVLAATDLSGLAEPVMKFKAAVIGHTGRGDYGHGLEGIFNNRPNVDGVALADPDAEGRAKAVAKIGARHGYADYRGKLDKEPPNRVSIAMRQSEQHHAIALAALKLGAHIYCEKPFVMWPAESDELLAEADKRGLKIAVAHTMRMSPLIVGLKQAIEEGQIGDIVEAR